MIDGRWINLTRQQEVDLWDRAMIFSHGPRICLGKEYPSPYVMEITRRLALVELRMLLAALVMRYSWSGVPGNEGKWDVEMMPFEFILIRPRKDRCVLKLELRD
jgi:cytochrome P450